MSNEEAMRHRGAQRLDLSKHPTISMQIRIQDDDGIWYVNIHKMRPKDLDALFEMGVTKVYEQELSPADQVSRPPEQFVDFDIRGFRMLAGDDSGELYRIEHEGGAER